MSKVGKYELVRKLATGGMAEVFLARFEWARGLEKTVVVKRILYHLAEDPNFIDMFFTEAQLAAQLSHPNIAQIIEFGESEGVYFLAMEYVDGPSLRALAAAAHTAGTGLPFPHCARIAACCCEALTHAHELVDQATGKPLNLVHRDVSPDNVLISKTGSVKLVDFGIAKAATQGHHTKTGLVKGKLAYMSSEQLRAEPLDCRADIFSLGVMLYELIAGRKPYEAPSEITLIHAMLYEDMVPLRTRRKDVPPALEQIVNKALERDRDDRWSSCREMHAALEQYLLSAQQMVSALQIAELVKKYQHTPEGTEGAPTQPLATPEQPRRLAKTPEPWRAERTPAASSPTAQLRQPRLRTGTDGSDARETELEVPIVAPLHPAKPAEARPSSVSAVPEPSFPSPPPPVLGAKKSRKTAKRPWTLAVAAGIGFLLIAGGIGFAVSRRSAPEHLVSASPVEPAPEPVAMAPAAPVQPEQSPLPPLSPPKPSAPKVKQTLPSKPRPPVKPTPPPAPKQFGKVTIRTRPASRAIIDTIDRGTLVVDLPLEAGEHTASLECDSTDPGCAQVSDRKYTEHFTVEPDKTYVLKHFFK